jgi:hypothetical protein
LAKYDDVKIFDRKHRRRQLEYRNKYLEGEHLSPSISYDHGSENHCLSDWFFRVYIIVV